MNLAASGIAADKHGYIQVNDKLETNVPGVFALGDINGGPAFTHISYDDFRILRDESDGEGKRVHRRAPGAVHGVHRSAIGPHRDDRSGSAREKREIRVAKMPMNYVARALEVDETRGFMKAVVDAKSNQILGAAVLGIEGGEIMSQIQLAMMGGSPTRRYGRRLRSSHAAESLNNLFQHFTSLKHSARAARCITIFVDVRHAESQHFVTTIALS